jgi:exodeoxyribonuclease VIII
MNNVDSIVKNGIYALKQNVERLAYVSNSKLMALKRSKKYFYDLYIAQTIERVESKSLITGKQIHAALLEPARFERLYIVQPDFGDQRSKANKEAKIEWLSKQSPEAIIVTEETMHAIQEIVKSVKNHKHCLQLLQGGRPEHHAYAYDSEFDLLLYAIPDFINESGIVVDLKTTGKVLSEKFVSQEIQGGYFLQMAFYLRVMSILGFSKSDFAWIFAETIPSYDVAAFYPSKEIMEAGENEIKRLLSQYKEMQIKDPTFSKQNLWTGIQPEGRIEEIKADLWFASKYNVGMIGG